MYYLLTRSLLIYFTNNDIVDSSYLPGQCSLEQGVGTLVIATDHVLASNPNTWHSDGATSAWPRPHCLAYCCHRHSSGSRHTFSTKATVRPPPSTAPATPLSETRTPADLIRPRSQPPAVCPRSPFGMQHRRKDVSSYYVGRLEGGGSFRICWICSSW